MGRGTSGVKSGGGVTPSGVTLQQFQMMTEQEQADTVNRILADPNIKVDPLLDRSDATKVMYALGMSGVPQVVSDAVLDTMPGRDIYRTVYESGSMPPPKASDITDTYRYDSLVQLSGSGGSVHGRALYFATDFTDSTAYAWGSSSITCRAKINPNAKIMRETTLNNIVDGGFGNKLNTTRNDAKAITALAKGYDGWFSGTYTMLVDRSNITMSDTNKHASGRSWKTARKAN